MSQQNQDHQLSSAYVPPPTSYPPPAADGYSSAYVMAPPPMGYPTKDIDGQEQVGEKTVSRGDGFWKGCVAGLCCCWCFDICCF